MSQLRWSVTCDLEHAQIQTLWLHCVFFSSAGQFIQRELIYDPTLRLLCLNSQLDLTFLNQLETFSWVQPPHSSTVNDPNHHIKKGKWNKHTLKGLVLRGTICYYGNNHTKQVFLYFEKTLLSCVKTFVSVTPLKRTFWTTLRFGKTKHTNREMSDDATHETLLANNNNLTCWTRWEKHCGHIRDFNSGQNQCGTR